MACPAWLPAAWSHGEAAAGALGMPGPRGSSDRGGRKVDGCRGRRRGLAWATSGHRAGSCLPATGALHVGPGHGPTHPQPPPPGSLPLSGTHTARREMLRPGGLGGLGGLRAPSQAAPEAGLRAGPGQGQAQHSPQIRRAQTCRADRGCDDDRLHLRLGPFSEEVGRTDGPSWHGAPGTWPPGGSVPASRGIGREKPRDGAATTCSCRVLPGDGGPSSRDFWGDLGGAGFAIQAPLSTARQPESWWAAGSRPPVAPTPGHPHAYSLRRGDVGLV